MNSAFPFEAATREREIISDQEPLSASEKQLLCFYHRASSIVKRIIIRDARAVTEEEEKEKARELANDYRIIPTLSVSASK